MDILFSIRACSPRWRDCISSELRRSDHSGRSFASSRGPTSPRGHLLDRSRHVVSSPPCAAIAAGCIARPRDRADAGQARRLGAGQRLQGARCRPKPRAARHSRVGRAGRTFARELVSLHPADSQPARGRRYVSTVPRWETRRWTYDKRLTYQLAADLHVDHPRTHYPRDKDDVLAFDGRYPAILKPAIRSELNRFTESKAWPAGDGPTLVARYEEATALVEPALIMIQELIPGGGESQLSFAALCRDGIPVASLVARRTRQWPMDFGRASTYVETVEAPEVEGIARRILESLRFDGIVEVEFKRDARDGTLKLLDINPRVWGWHSLGRRAGVDFPYLLWRQLRGERVEA